MQELFRLFEKLHTHAHTHTHCEQIYNLKYLQKSNNEFKIINFKSLTVIVWALQFRLQLLDKLCKT